MVINLKMGDQRIQQTVLDCFLSLPVALKQSRSSKRYGPSPGMEFNSAIGLSSLYRCSRKPSNSKNNRIIPKQRATTMLFRYCQSFFFFLKAGGVHGMHNDCLHLNGVIPFFVGHLVFQFFCSQN